MLHGDRLAGQGRFVAKKILCLDETEVGRDNIATFQQDDVARDHMFRQDGFGFSLQPDPGGPRAELTKRLHGTRRAKLSEKANQRIDDEHEQNGRGFGQTAERGSHGSGSGQQPHHGALELVDKDGKHRAVRMSEEGIRPILSKPQRGFRLGKPASKARFELLKHGARGKRIRGGDFRLRCCL